MLGVGSARLNSVDSSLERIGRPLTTTDPAPEHMITNFGLVAFLNSYIVA